MTPLDGAEVRGPRSARGGAFLSDVLAGLRHEPKRLSPKYLYDLEGARLFDAICELPEYYVTRTELEILELRAHDIAAELARRTSCRVVEPGAGSGTKTRLLLRALGEGRCVEYVPVDIAGEHLEETARALREELPWLRVTPIAADFTAPLPVGPSTSPTVVYFPGSTLGNFDPTEAVTLLSRFREVGRVVVLGIDMKKDPQVLHAAYNDARGVTAAFNKNLLRRANVELGADFDLDAFYHYAPYVPSAGRIEMHLVSARRQDVRVGDDVFPFEQGESICTEHSYKYDLASLEALGRAAGLSLDASFFDEDGRFVVVILRAT